MRTHPTAAAALAVLLTSSSLPVAAAEQARTIFNTPDFRQDRALWSNPAYYRNGRCFFNILFGLNAVI